MRKHLLVIGEEPQPPPRFFYTLMVMRAFLPPISSRHPTRRRALALLRGTLPIGLTLATLTLAACSRSDDDSATPVAYTAIFGEVGINPGQFSYPRAMDSDTESLWIIDKMARVQRIDAKTHAVTALWQMPEWKLGKPTGIAVWAPDGPRAQSLRVFVPDTHYHRVMVYRPNEGSTGPGDAFVLEKQFGSYGEGDGQFIYPTDVAVVPGPDGRTPTRLLVSEYGGHDRISIYDLDLDGAYRFVRSFGQFGNGAGPHVEFNRPQSIEIDRRRGELVVADACNHRVGRFTLDGQLIAWIGTRAEGTEGSDLFKYPYGICLLEDGTALVSEFGGNRISVIDVARGVRLRSIGAPGRASGQLASPWAVTVVDTHAFILDSGNNRVVQFDAPAGRVTAPSVAAMPSAKGGGG